MRSPLLWCFVITALVAGAASANLITNGSFENASVDPGSNFLTLGLGNTSINGWTVTAGTIDYIGGYWQASDGVRSIDLAGNGMGAIADPFYTELDVPYLLQFDLAGNPDGGAKIKTVDVAVSAVGSTTTPTVYHFSFDTTGKSKLPTNGPGMGWTTETLLFTGFGANTQITFASGMGTSPYGPALDNVRVNAAVPEPMSIILGIMGLSSVAGFRKLRRK